jgi:hypothetical protein
MDAILKKLKRATDFDIRKFQWGEKQAKLAFPVQYVHDQYIIS